MLSVTSPDRYRSYRLASGSSGTPSSAWSSTPSSSGDPLGLAEVVRDGIRRNGSLGGQGATPRLTESERRLYVQARQLLAREIGAARGLEQADPDTWLEEQVAST